MTRRRFARLLAVAGMSASGVLAGCGGTPTPSASSTVGTSASADEESLLSTTVFAFDTVCTFKAACSQAVLDEAAAMCGRFEALFSRTRADSDVSRVNAAQGAPVRVAPETAALVSAALAYSRDAGGLFDITIGAASELWDFVAGTVPDEGALAEAVRHIGYRTVSVEGDEIALGDRDARIDVGGIAKGYIADALCSFLEGEGCASGFVNLGGNVKTIGLRPDGTPWRVGIQDPNGIRDSALAAVRSAGGSVVTSGLYERQFERDGRRYWHILDPRTGYPAESDLASVSVLSASSLDGDALATALFLMGRDAALEWANARAGIDVVLVSGSGEVSRSDGCEAELL